MIIHGQHLGSGRRRLLSVIFAYPNLMNVAEDTGPFPTETSLDHTKSWPTHNLNETIKELVSKA
jgi:hypothetical protein